MGCIVRGDADLNPVSNHDLDPVLFHPPGKHTPYTNIVITLDFHSAATKDLGNDSLYLN